MIPTARLPALLKNSSCVRSCAEGSTRGDEAGLVYSSCSLKLKKQSLGSEKPEDTVSQDEKVSFCVPWERDIWFMWLVGHVFLNHLGHSWCSYTRFGNTMFRGQSDKTQQHAVKPFTASFTTNSQVSKKHLLSVLLQQGAQCNWRGRQEKTSQPVRTNRGFTRLSHGDGVIQRACSCCA